MALVIALVPAPSWATQDAAPASADVPSESSAQLPNEGEARKLSNEAKVLYDVGDYSEAAQRYRRLYELMPNPDILYNLAQAERLAGHCKRALDAYKSFLRLSTASATAEKRTYAEAHIVALTATCRDPVPTPAPAPSVVAPAEHPPAPAPKRGGNFWLLTSAGAAVALLAGATTVYVWNDSRYRDWKKNDQALALGESDPNWVDWASSTRANNEKWRSIERFDRVVLGLGIAGAACAAVAAVLGVKQLGAGASVSSDSSSRALRLDGALRW